MYYPARLCYIVMQTKCYHSWSTDENDRCLIASHKVNNSATIITCASITLFTVVDLLLIWDTIRDKLQDRKVLRNTFRFNYVTVGMIITMLILQIVSVYMTMPWVHGGQLIYNVLDFVICFQYLALLCFFLDMSLIRENNGSSMIIDELGNVIVIRYNNDTTTMHQSIISNDETLDSYYPTKTKKINSMRQFLPDAGNNSIISDDSSD